MQTQEFEQLFNKYSHSVRAFIWRRSAGLDVAISSADDIEADVWSIAWSRKEAAPVDVELELAWLFQISRHVLANHIRKSDTRRKIANTFHPEEISELAADSLVLLNEEIVEVLMNKAQLRVNELITQFNASEDKNFENFKTKFATSTTDCSSTVVRHRLPCSASVDAAKQSNHKKTKR